ncbi:MAG: adenosylcobinamide-phosphate synthase CbiB [Bacillota bacterium]
MWYHPLCALVLDFIIGDPPKIPHPVIGMGHLIHSGEKLLYPQKPEHKMLTITRGAVLAGSMVIFIFVLSFMLLNWLRQLQPLLADLVEIWFIATTIASKGLAQAGRDIYILLKAGKILEARQKVGWIVGRDTDKLDEGEISRAAIETIAENTVDGVIAPLFYAFLGGAPLALTYRVINTMDSMLGYKNERYLYFGRAAARLDDAANFIPARLTGFFLLVVMLLSPRLNFSRALHSWKKEACLHPSPNSGIPEAVVAGGLGIRLGGLNYYGGMPHFRDHLGPGLLPIAPEHIQDTIKIMYRTSLLAAVVFTAIFYLIK